MILLRIFILNAIFAFGIASHAEEKIDLVTACKQECPKAKTNDEAHKCAEKNGRLNKEFRKSKCWTENEKYEESLKEKK